MQLPKQLSILHPRLMDPAEHLLPAAAVVARKWGLRRWTERRLSLYLLPQIPCPHPNLQFQPEQHLLLEGRRLTLPH